jgi:hypothetical protein
MTQQPGTPSSDLPYPAWQPEYKAALLELNPKKLRSVCRRQKMRFSTVCKSWHKTPTAKTIAERQAIEDALANLRVLQRDKLGFPEWKKE